MDGPPPTDPTNRLNHLLIDNQPVTPIVTSMARLLTMLVTIGIVGFEPLMDGLTIIS